MALKIKEEIKNIFVEEKSDIPVLPLLAEKLINMKRSYAEVEEKANILKKEIESLSQQIFNTMLQQHLQSFKREDGITISAYSEEVYYINKEYMEDFLREAEGIGWGCFIKKTFSWRSLQTLIKELQEALGRPGLTMQQSNNIKVKLDSIRKYLTDTTKKNIRITGLNK